MSALLSAMDFNNPGLEILTLKKEVHLVRLAFHQSLPSAFGVDGAESPGHFHSVTRTPEETSVLTSYELGQLDESSKREGPFKLLRMRGPLPLGMLNVLSQFSAALGNAGVSILAFSTYDTDYVAVKQHQYRAAWLALEKAGWKMAWAAEGDHDSPWESHGNVKA